LGGADGKKENRGAPFDVGGCAVGCVEGLEKLNGLAHTPEVCVIGRVVVSLGAPNKSTVCGCVVGFGASNGLGLGASNKPDLGALDELDLGLSNDQGLGASDGLDFGMSNDQGLGASDELDLGMSNDQGFGAPGKLGPGPPNQPRACDSCASLRPSVCVCND